MGEGGIGVVFEGFLEGSEEKVGSEGFLGKREQAGL